MPFIPDRNAPTTQSFPRRSGIVSSQTFAGHNQLLWIAATQFSGLKVPAVYTRPLASLSTQTTETILMPLANLSMRTFKRSALLIRWLLTITMLSPEKSSYVQDQARARGEVGSHPVVLDRAVVV